MTPEESDAAWDQYFREEYPEISDSLHREIDEWIEQLTKDWPPPDSPQQLAVLRKYFGPHRRAVAERDEPDKTKHASTMQLCDPAS